MSTTPSDTQEETGRTPSMFASVLVYGYIPPYGEDKMAGFIRRAAKMLAGE